MNNSQNKENSPQHPGKGERLSSKDKKLMDAKAHTNKISKDKHKGKGGLLDESLVKPHGLTFKTRKLSADNTRTEKNTLKGIKHSNRSRKSNSGRPSHRNSRADSRDTTVRSKKEDAKASVEDDKPANNQVPSDPEKDSSPEVNEDKNIVTKFAFATRVGYIPNNPYKVNQDAYILNPNICKLPAFHYFGV